MGNTKVVAAVIGLMMTAAVAAQGIKDADTNQDGQVSLDEFTVAHEQRVAERFARLDANADGVISDDEFKAAREERRERMGQRRHRRGMNPEKAVERLDVDESGGVSLQELEGKRFSPDSATFYAADSDGNGELDAAELKKMHDERRAARRAARDGN